MPEAQRLVHLAHKQSKCPFFPTSTAFVERESNSCAPIISSRSPSVFFPTTPWRVCDRWRRGQLAISRIDDVEKSTGPDSNCTLLPSHPHLARTPTAPPTSFECKVRRRPAKTATPALLAAPTTSISTPTSQRTLRHRHPPSAPTRPARHRKIVRPVFITRASDSSNWRESSDEPLRGLDALNRYDDNTLCCKASHPQVGAPSPIHAPGASPASPTTDPSTNRARAAAFDTFPNQRAPRRRAILKDTQPWSPQASSEDLRSEQPR